MKELAAALARQREALKILLQEAAIPPAPAEPVLLEVFLEIEEQGTEPADNELLQRVQAACAAPVARRKAAGEKPRPIQRRKRRR